jgi:transitional endoplasmic reticulum ATPase
VSDESGTTAAQQSTPPVPSIGLGPDLVSDIERGLIARYLHRLLTRTELPVRTQRSIVHWLYNQRFSFDLEIPAPLNKAIADCISGESTDVQMLDALTAHRIALLAMLDQIALETPRPEPLATNIELLTAELGLSRAAWKVIGAIACHQRFDTVRNLGETMANTVAPLAHLIALMVAEPRSTVEQLLQATGPLAGNGIVRLADSWGLWGQVAIPQQLNMCLDQTHANLASLRDAMLGVPAVTENTSGDYDHVRPDRDLMIKVLSGAVREGARGINILLYGPPGSGKTEMTKVVAAAAELTLYAVSEQSTWGGGEADRSERLATLVFAQQILKGTNNAALLFDEMEDVAWQFMKRGGSKAYLNRLLETNTVPILWTSNNISEIDPALLRRMTLAVELRLPPPVQRERIIGQLSRRVGVELSEAEIGHLARRIDGTPAVLANALRAAKLSGGGAAAVEQAALGIQRAAFGVETRHAAPAAAFVPELVCASEDLVLLADQIVAGGRLNFSFCLSGPPGTGKSAFARYLARRLNLDILHKRASDLLGMYVGESEKRIAAAFAEARDLKSVLIFDEADSLLMDRRDARHTWEITQVNEMLTQMEDHSYPSFFTTNLMDRIDQASLRRFTFDIRFTYLDPVALARAWATFFGGVAMPSEVLSLGNLTPGDFAQVRNRADVLGLKSKPASIAALLFEISRQRPGGGGRMGFRN